MKSGSLTFIKIIIGALAIVALVVSGYQLYKYNFVSIKTESAVMGELEEVVKAEGVFIRNENAVSKSGYDYLDVIRTEGERVASDGVIARVYADEYSAKIRKEIRQIEDKIATYEEVLASSGSYQSSGASIDREIYSSLNEIASLSQNGNAVDAFDKAEDVVISLMKKKISSGDLVSYDTVLKGLKAELSALKNSGSDSFRTISTPKSGYFSLATDGLEDVFTEEYLSQLDVDSFDEALNLCTDLNEESDNLGKMMYDNSWSVTLKVPSSSIDRLEVQDTVYIRIPSFGADKIKCTIMDLRKEGEETLVVLSSSIISGNILTLRREEISLIVHTYTGLVVRQSALRKVDGVDGVYVKVGLLLRYKAVDVLYNDGSSAVLNYDATNEAGLRIFDQVVYKGSDLYDRKAVA